METLNDILSALGIALSSLILFALFFGWLEVKRPSTAMRSAPPTPFRLPAMTSAARIVLAFMPAGPAIPARLVGQKCSLSASCVLAAQRDLRALGLAKYGPAANDNGRIAGSGYSLTDAGLELQRRLAEVA